ncbi:hypothetical protein [Fusobacterium sp.]|uniref:hypothetical protein n=1 Tax=Fusobacterium sp. TaxID=68766 RepID=UPI002901A245|nr:hypothetical protein [Fusobacterium sp.]MDU1911324.1 hypothetical protein [Fusobacterium sp.]
MKRNILIFLLLLILGACGQKEIYKTKNDVSRVKNEISYSINYDEFYSYLKEAFPKIKFEKQEPRITKSGKYVGVITWKKFKLECNFKEKNSELTSIYLSSPKGETKHSKTVALIKNVEFNQQDIKDLKKYSLVINNILNSSNTQNQMQEFLNGKLKKNIERGKTQIGYSRVTLKLSGSTLLVVFEPNIIK